MRKGLMLFVTDAYPNFKPGSHYAILSLDTGVNWRFLRGSVDAADECLKQLSGVINDASLFH